MASVSVSASTETSTAARPTAPGEFAFLPPVPRALEETGLSLAFLADLSLKILYNAGYLTGGQLAERLRLPYTGVTEVILDFLKREQLVEVQGARGVGEQAYQYALTARGRDRAREALDRSQYAGPAPVPLSAYAVAMRRQSHKGTRVTPRLMRQALGHLVLNDRVFHKIGPAINSGTSIFLYGPPGNGKTSIAEAIGHRVFQGSIFIPYAVEVGGFVIKVFDEVNHEPLTNQRSSQTGVLKAPADARWIAIRRPFIVSGGELTLEMLDLTWNEVSRYYEAPLQMKANGGVFLIDDFGRQQVRPRDLLNRWIVPLEKGVDYLTLHTGQKFEIPFETLILFSTNLNPRDLVDEAFLRRIRHKIEIPDPSPAEFREIFRRECQARGIPYDDQALVYLLQEWYVKRRRPLRAVHARDLLAHIQDIAAYFNVPPTLNKELIDRACEAYFVEMGGPSPAASPPKPSGAS
ncbi:ATP-binding protein [Thermoflexus sp.]|uniref:ATP-binding protein n=1 Tax=Thermoflexus sp. TaxID=1969742 RepID=UPI0035E42302